MRRAHRHLGGLLAGVAVLAALAAWQWRSDRAGTVLLDIAPTSVTRIAVTRAGQPTRRYVKHDGHWYRRGKRVDAAHLHALAALAATPVLQWRKVSTVDLAAVGLAAPPVTVRIDGHVLAYGTLAAFGPQRFVRVGRRVAVVPASYSPRSPEATPAFSSSSQKS